MSETMRLQVQCAVCREMIAAESRVAETAVRCPHCGATVSIPGTGLKSGVTVGGFRVERSVGRGGMGEVFLATQISLNRRVALKVLPAELALLPARVERFLREVRMLAAIEHPNLVTAFEAGEDSGVHYLAMAYVDGETLAARVRRAGPMPEQEALRIAIDVARALGYVWDRHRLLHRDIKPSNIMVDRFKQVHVMDLGLAKSLSESTDLTLSGHVLGTPAYMSPEQVRTPNAVDFRSDIYSLGAALYHLLTGRPVFDGDTPLNLIQQHLSKPPPSPRQYNPRISKACEHLLAVMLAKRPELRQRSWEAAVADMERVSRGRRPLTARPGVGAWRHRGRRVVAAVKALFLGRTREVRLIRWAGFALVGLGFATLAVFLAVRHRSGVRNLAQAPARTADGAVSVSQSSSPPASSTALPPTPATPVFEVVARAPGSSPPAVDIEKRVRVALEAIKARNPMLKAVKSRFRKTDRGVALDLMDNPALRDISGLRGLPLVDLELGLTGVSDLHPLEGMPLTKLGLRRTQVADLGPVAECPIETLDLTGTPVKDLRPLGKMPLKELRLEDCTALDDLSPLSRCWILERLIVPAHCRKIAIVRDLPNLKFLNTTWDDWKLTAAEFWKQYDAAHAPAPAVAPLETGPTPAQIDRARRGLDTLVGSLADALLAGRPAQAVPRFEAARKDPRLAPVSRDLEAVDVQLRTAANVATLLEKSFQAEIGQDIVVRFRAGPCRLRVRKVGNGVVQGLVPVKSGRGQGVMGQRFRLADLALDEIARRLEQEAPGTGSVAVGLLACAQNDTARARRAFKTGGALGRALETRVEKLKTQADAVRHEQRAESELRNLLRMLGLPPATDDAGKLGDAIAHRTFSKGTVETIQTRVKTFRDHYGTTAVAKRLAPALDALVAVNPYVQKSPFKINWKRPRPALIKKTIKELRRVNNIETDLKYTYTIDDAKKRIALNLTGNKGLVDISPLRGMPLKSLNLRDTGVKDLAALVGMPLQSLELYGIDIKNIAPLYGMPLEVLNIGQTLVSDLTPLRKARLHSLVACATGVHDLSPLAGQPLTSLLVYDTPRVSSLLPLAGMELEVLQIHGTAVHDITPIAGMPLRNLDIEGLEIKDFSPLRGLPLTGLCASGTAFSGSDMALLRGMPLLLLHLSDCPNIDDLHPLVGMPLQNLRLSNCPNIHDLLPLAGMPLQDLQLSNCPNIHDLSPLLDCPDLRKLVIPRQIKDTEFLRKGLKHLESISYE